jgi:hypothetical protein
MRVAVGFSMASTPRQAEALRAQVTRTIERTTDLMADLKVLADALDTLVPDDAERTETERWREVARVAALDPDIPERLEALVEALADVLAGLTSADNGAHWLRHQLARLAAGDDAAAA